MPISKYDKYYGSKKGSASKALTAMRERYGTAKGTSIFYAKAQKERQSRPDSCPRSKYEGDE